MYILYTYDIGIRKKTSTTRNFSKYISWRFFLTEKWKILFANIPISNVYMDRATGAKLFEPVIF